MVSDFNRTRKGQVGVQSNGGYLRLSLPRMLYEGKQKFISLALPDTPENRKLAEVKAAVITADIIYERFDYTWAKYTRKGNLIGLPTPEQKPQLTVGRLWEMYCEYKRPQVAATTYIRKYEGMWKRPLEKFVDTEVTEIAALRVRSHLLETVCSETAKSLLAALDNACQWATRHKLLQENPFLGMAGEIKIVRKTKHKSADEDDTYIAFTVEERDAIIEEFELVSNIKHWAPFVKFLFWTGCRPGEAIALKWKHIKSDCSAIVFCESYDCLTNITKDTKTHSSRIFRCGEKLQKLLLSVKPKNVNPEGIVFKTQRNKRINWRGFSRLWGGHPSNRVPSVIKRLVEQGKIKQYLKPYATRHTFITLQLQAGINPKDIAKWCGNSPEVIEKYYADVTRDLMPAET